MSSTIPQHKLPTLHYAYDAFEPHISAQIMELHHGTHHQTYINNLNAALTAHAEAVASGAIVQQLHQQQAIKFNAGGHVNHSLFWKNLAPAKTTSPSPSAAKHTQFVAAVEKRFGSVEQFKDALEAAALGIQGSGWAWLVLEEASGSLSIVTTKDQDIPPKGNRPLLGVDMWEHAFYLQYQTKKKAYLTAIWNVMNWDVAEKRLAGGELEEYADL